MKALYFCFRHKMELTVHVTILRICSYSKTSGNQTSQNEEFEQHQHKE